MSHPLNRLQRNHLERAAWECEPQRARNRRATRTLTPAEFALVGAERADLPISLATLEKEPGSQQSQYPGLNRARMDSGKISKGCLL